jgi:hypothetical protein
MNIYNNIVISPIYIKGDREDNKYLISSIEEYFKILKKDKYLYELIGGQSQIKPCFDLESYYNIEITNDERLKEKIINCKTIGINKCNLLFPNKLIKICSRDVRKVKHNNEKCYKISFHFIIQNVRISWFKLRDLLKNEDYENDKPFDLSIYQKNKIFSLPFATKKDKINNDNNDEKPTSLKPEEDNYNLFDYCASYIQEDYENWDDKIQNKIEFITTLYDDDNKEKEKYNGNLNFPEIMEKLSKERATNYQEWFYICVSLINLYYRKFLTRGMIYDLFDLFSSKANNYNSDSVSKTIDINITRFNGIGYGIKYLLECLKIDNYEYYKSITKKDMIIDNANDDVGASEIVINHYRNILIICKGILYINDNNIWISNEKQVDKLLINMIGQLDIKFYGVDEKRKYSYNTSIKHIKNCIIIIKANKTIINDNFYNDMIKNNKYYLPFNDCIYSFENKKTYNYNELPNIYFTYKINRNFPKYYKKDYDDLMDKVINPIYPNEDERIYNAHIKSRALAGCYEDKRWYGYSGSRNSGKGTETGLLRNAFGDYVLEFNAKCLIFNKYGNQEPAKALSWVVDKKDARIIISNEIDGDNDTKLNGAFIKTLASGGDAMDGRRLYENAISFIPQFTMFLCYNKFYEVIPNDAMENLEQFEYKSKFVSKDELIDNVEFLKLKDDNIKMFIKEDKIIDAYTLYILNAFTNPRMNTPQNIKNSTEINYGEIIITVEQFILNNFKNSNDGKDRLHIETINNIINNNGYKLTNTELNKLFNRFGIGKYNKMCNINKIKKTGFDFIKYINN